MIRSKITVRAFAKVNLSIDVGDLMNNGYHKVDMLMQQISFHDDVTVSIEKELEPGSIRLDPGRDYLPNDSKNFAYKAAAIMRKEFPQSAALGGISIVINKRIPVAAGLAGGSGDAAAVMHGLNILWGLNLTLKQICRFCARIGSDVPFSAMCQAYSNYNFPYKLRRDKLAAPCARARGRGTELEAVNGIEKPIVIAKPRLSVSTAEAYGNLDDCRISERPDNDRLIRDMKSGSDDMYDNFINVLENYTLAHYPEVADLKAKMCGTGARAVLMSGSGPTVFAVYDGMEKAQAVSNELRAEGYEAYWTKTFKRRAANH